jgi:Chaperone of endosialidase
MSPTTASQWKKSHNLLILIGLLSFPSALRAQSTAFKYQGALSAAGQAANGRYDLTFALYTESKGGSPAAGPLATNAVAVSNGLFTAVLDFGAGTFDGTSYWLEIGVRTNGESSFVTLSPRQALRPTPYAVYAQGADAAGLKGTIPTSSFGGLYDKPVTLSHPSNIFSGDGSGLTGVDAATVQGMTADELLSSIEDGSGLTNVCPGNISPGTAAIDISGNAATANYANYTGVASNAPGSPFALDVKGAQTNEGPIYISNSSMYFNGGIVLGTDGSINTGGYLSMWANMWVYDIPAAHQDMITIGCDVPNGIVSYGGQPFLVLYDRLEGGGSTNSDWPCGANSLAIGQYGQILLHNPWSQCWDAYEPQFNSPQLVFQGEVMTNLHAYGPTNYWGISQGSNLLTIGPMTGIIQHMNGADQGYTRKYVEGAVLPSIVITPAGNVGIGTASPNHTLEVAGSVSATTFINSSDRSLKEGFRGVDVQEVLEGVATLPIQRWNFKDIQTQHIGPMAQDFSAAFKVGPDDKHIDTLDANGVALAAIQGLNNKLTEALKQKQAEIMELRQRLDRLEQLFPQNSGGKADSADRDKGAARDR